MTHFIRNGNSWNLLRGNALDIRSQLPAATYSIEQNPLTHELFLAQVDSLTVPLRVYGSATKHADRIIQTFTDRKVSTGVLLSGDKGSGKTLLAKMLSVRLLEKSIPTILVAKTFEPELLNNFIQGIGQPCVILMDEFEKVFWERVNQEGILTLLDGVFSCRMLFILTCNDVYKIDGHMRNRPGRLFYNLEFSGLSNLEIREYCEENLKDKSEIDKICKLAVFVEKFSFDQLQALVQEMNRYNEKVFTALELLNIKPEKNSGSNYEIKVTSKDYTITSFSPINAYGNPMGDNDLSVFVEYTVKKEKKEEEISLSNKNLVSMSAEKGVFLYEKNGFAITYTRQEKVPFNYNQLAF